MTYRPVLLVEDDSDAMELTLRSLKQCNLANQVVVFKDGESAIDYLHSDADSILPAVILLDLQLPKLSGLEVLQTIRTHNRTRTLPVVILSSSDNVADLEASYDLGANSFVKKPLQLDDFAKAAARIGLYWTILNFTTRA